MRRLGSQSLDGADVQVIEARRLGVGRVEAATDGQPLGVRLFREPLQGLRRHPEVQRDDYDAGEHGAVVDGRQGGSSWAPGEESVALVEAKGAQAPGNQLGMVAQVGGSPREGQAFVGAQGKLAPAGPALRRIVEQVEQRRERSRIRYFPGQSAMSLLGASV